MFQSLKHDSETHDEGETSFSVDLDLGESSVHESSSVLVEESITPPRVAKRDQSPSRKKTSSIDYRNGKFVKIIRKVEGVALYRSAIIRDNAINIICFAPKCGTDRIPIDQITQASDGWNPGSQLTFRNGHQGVINWTPQIFVSWLTTGLAAPICEKKWSLVNVQDIVGNATVGREYNIPTTNVEVHDELMQIASIVPVVRDWLNSPAWTLHLPPNFSLNLTDEQQLAFFKLTNTKLYHLHQLLAYLANEIPLARNANVWTKVGAPSIQLEIRFEQPQEDLFLLPRDGTFWVVPSQANDTFKLGKSSSGMRNLVARYCPSLRKATLDERILLNRCKILGKKAPTTNLVLLSEMVAYLDRIDKPVPPSLRQYCAK